ncbi:MAG TPA: hypothetical protein VK947_14065 [Planococcus sp. (in: firmicutes)]|nr:hypothetical protein [Planococcus sp. (in: firmicutes)]
MEGNLYTIEILHQGKYESWNFKNETERNKFFERIKTEFKEQEIPDKSDDIEDERILQLSASSLKLKNEEVSQTVPFEWFEAIIFEDMLSFINEEYEKLS